VCSIIISAAFIAIHKPAIIVLGISLYWLLKYYRLSAAYELLTVASVYLAIGLVYGYATLLHVEPWGIGRLVEWAIVSYWLIVLLRTNNPVLIRVLIGYFSLSTILYLLFAVFRSPKGINQQRVAYMALVYFVLAWLLWSWKRRNQPLPPSE
jgi:hypothetical protein